MGMSEGQQVVCDRCGNTVFLKYLGDEARDGGYSRYRKYESLPEEWLYTTQMGYLCADCAKMFKAFVTEFKKGRVAPAWFDEDWKGVDDAGNRHDEE